MHAYRNTDEVEILALAPAALGSTGHPRPRVTMLVEMLGGAAISLPKAADGDL